MPSQKKIAASSSRPSRKPEFADEAPRKPLWRRKWLMGALAYIIVGLAVMLPARSLYTERHQREVGLPRSEEHTSELQSLMRISYAVFCLKKKKKCSNNSTK